MLKENVYVEFNSKNYIYIKQIGADWGQKIITGFKCKVGVSINIKK